MSVVLYFALEAEYHLMHTLRLSEFCCTVVMIYGRLLLLCIAIPPINPPSQMTTVPNLLSLLEIIPVWHNRESLGTRAWLNNSQHIPKAGGALTVHSKADTSFAVPVLTLLSSSNARPHVSVPPPHFRPKWLFKRPAGE